MSTFMPSNSITLLWRIMWLYFQYIATLTWIQKVVVFFTYEIYSTGSISSLVKSIALLAQWNVLKTFGFCWNDKLKHWIDKTN